jgi:hypothetical protein
VGSRGSNFNDVADLGYVDWIGTLPNMTDLERESVIAHSAGLLTTRHNLFTIIVRAEAYASPLGGLPGKSGHASAPAHRVFQMWRDPFRLADGSHTTMVTWSNSVPDSPVGQAICDAIGQDLSWALHTLWPVTITNGGSGVSMRTPRERYYSWPEDDYRVTYRHEGAEILHTWRLETLGGPTNEAVLATNVLSLSFEANWPERLIRIDTEVQGESPVSKQVRLLY